MTNNHRVVRPSGPRVIRVLQSMYDAARAVLEEGGERTGIRWHRPDRHCPDWCAGDHRCTARHGYPNGEHRARQVVLYAPYGKLVAGRVQRADSGPRLEVSVTVALSYDEQAAVEQGGTIPIAVDLAVRTVLLELFASRLMTRMLPRSGAALGARS